MRTGQYKNWAQAKTADKFDNGPNLAKGFTLNIFEMKKAIGKVLPVAHIVQIKAWL